MEKIGLPKISEEKIDKNHSRFIIEPLYPGYGPTIGNSLRRVLLSSIMGASATSFKVDGVNHEFSPIEHVKEDMVELMMNIKSINFKSFSEEPVVLELTKKGPGEVTAADFKANSNIEISNPEQHLVSLDNKANFRMEIVVEQDRGFRPASVASGEKKEIGQIAIDASFSPVDRVSFLIEDTRVGQMTNFDKLILDVITNGTVTPEYSLKEASKVLVDHFQSIMNDAQFDLEVTEPFGKEGEVVPEEVEESDEEEKEISLEGKMKVEEAGFSPRTTNALINSGIKTIAGLKRLSSLKIEEIKGLGKKGVDEIKDKLK
ncbi:MAG: DNA-directed RNA polymerase subunit alpha [Patescibacteria group bacterium]|jgi:DNA-directed RNA polymerase subunit alpha